MANSSSLRNRLTCELVFLLVECFKGNRRWVKINYNTHHWRIERELRNRGYEYFTIGDSEWVNAQLAEYHLLVEDSEDKA